MTWVLGEIEDEKNMKQQLKSLLMILPFIMIILIAGGGFLGIQLSKMLGTTDSFMWALLFATIGFLISILISILIIKMKINNEE